MSNREILEESLSNLIRHLEEEKNKVRSLFLKYKDPKMHDYYSELDESIIKYNYILSSLSEESK